jgi:ribosomal RNA-processing protein 7
LQSKAHACQIEQLKLFSQPLSIQIMNLVSLLGQQTPQADGWEGQSFKYAEITPTWHRNFELHQKPTTPTATLNSPINQQSTMPSTNKPPKPAAKKIPTTVSDLLVLPITFPPLPSYPKSTTHYLYLRPDAPPIPNRDTPRSLFVSNVPITATESAFRTLFKHLCGALVQRVDFECDVQEDVLSQLGLRKGSEVTVKGTKVVREDSYGAVVAAGQKRKRGNEDEDEQAKQLAQIAGDMRLPSTWDRPLWKSGSSAVVVFVDKAAMETAFKACRAAVKKSQNIEWPSPPSSDLGSSRYKRHILSLSHPPRHDLTHRINAYLSAFTALEAEREKLLQKQRSVPDEDGFVTVVRSRRSVPAKLEEAMETQRIHREREEKRAGKDFYRFQNREVRKERERALKRDYESDRAKLVEMRRRRGAVRPED